MGTCGGGGWLWVWALNPASARPARGPFQVNSDAAAMHGPVWRG